LRCTPLHPVTVPERRIGVAGALRRNTALVQDISLRAAPAR
jgi:hypothetical protein